MDPAYAARSKFKRTMFKTKRRRGGLVKHRRQTFKQKTLSRRLKEKGKTPKFSNFFLSIHTSKTLAISLSVCVPNQQQTKKKIVNSILGILRWELRGRRSC